MPERKNNPPNNWHCVNLERLLGIYCPWTTNINSTLAFNRMTCTAEHIKHGVVFSCWKWTSRMSLIPILCNLTLIIRNHYVNVWIFLLLLIDVTTALGITLYIVTTRVEGIRVCQINNAFIWFFIFWRAIVFTKAFTETLSNASYCRSRKRSHLCLNNYQFFLHSNLETLTLQNVFHNFNNTSKSI